MSLPLIRRRYAIGFNHCTRRLAIVEPMSLNKLAVDLRNRSHHSSSCSDAFDCDLGACKT
ncbi:hypothetical protein N7451_004897 [Penicillium sp. IBT 35674x]|nr:hypothetical protein N7451_004897 [Penicillium sp. IBT 35674x]